jgi:hypothetical protein
MNGMTSSNISERYKEMLDLISLKQLATELRSKCAREEQHQITEASMLRLIRKKNIQYISMSRVKYLTPVDVDNLLEALKLSGKQIRRKR